MKGRQRKILVGMVDNQKSSLTIDNEIVKELKNIKKLIALVNGEKIEHELGKYATTDDRKKIWVLIDGRRQSPEIAQLIGKTKRMVDVYLQFLENLGFVEQRVYGKPPVRSIEYVPSNWLNLDVKGGTTLELGTALAKDEE
jgi:hypothetical protein